MSDASAAEIPRRRGVRAWAYRSRRGLVLIGMTLLFFAVSLALFPRDHPVIARTDIYEIDLLLPSGATDGGAFIHLEPAGDGGTDVSIEDDGNTLVGARIYVEPDVWGSSTGCDRAFYSTVKCTPNRDAKKVVYSNIVADRPIHIPPLDGRGFGVARNAETIQAVLPAIEILQGADVASATQVVNPVAVLVELGNTDSYSWDSGDQPAAVINGFAAWDVPASDENAAVENGTSPSQQSTDTVLVFVAGSLLGVAAAALVAAVVEFV